MAACREAGVVADQPRVERAAPHRARRGERPGVPPRQEVGARQREAKQHPAGRGHGAAAGGPRRGPAGPQRGRRRADEAVVGGAGGSVRREQTFGQEPPRPVAAAQPRRRHGRATGEPGRRHGGALPGAGGREEPQGERQVGRVLVRRAPAGAGGRARADEPGAVPVRCGGGEGAGARGGGPHAAPRGGRAGGGGGGGELPPAGRRVLRHGAEQEAVHQGRAAGRGEDDTCRGCFVVNIHGSITPSLKKKKKGHVLRRKNCLPWMHACL
jgi:translation initiation factor IF-2